LLGIGIRTLSTYPKFLPAVQKLIVKVKLSDAESYAERLLAELSIKGIKEVVQQFGETFDNN
jgi:phosphoenolpyruvate-protein kinase (PTS system EI component)